MIEVLAFTLLVSIIFIGLTRIVVLSMRSSKLAQNTVLATHFAEELQEWVRGEKEEDWNQLVVKAATSPGLLYCVNSIPASISDLNSGSGCGSSFGLANLFKRELTLTKNSDGTQITAKIVVSWMENNIIVTVPVSTILSIWE